ncbi:MAG TPA: hypothetical protein PLI09_10400 [Candidatus Hydrogenedentes bacterium]|nr:hypothetical protein [Candidatus Hydrogenedentota bacterium]
MGRSLLLCANSVLFFSLITVLAFPAFGDSMEAGIETAYVKIIVNSFDGEPAPDPNTHDGDDNGIVDRAQFRLLDTVLRDVTAPHHDEVHAIYLANLAQMVDDNTLGSIKCKFMEILYHFTCTDFNRHAAGTLTLAEPVAVERLVYEFANGSGIQLDLDDYNLTLAPYFNGAGDLDGDGVTNADEFASVCGNFDAYISAAMDPAQTPDTVPCCGVCVLALTVQPQGGQLYAHDSHSFSVAVDDSEGDVHYQWYKNGGAAGPDAPEFMLPDLAVSDSGTYWCVVSDASETVTSDTAELVVADHMEITQQPEGGAYLVGDTHTFSVTVDGGLGTVQYQWFKDEAQLGPDAPEFVLDSLSEIDAGSYWCVVSDAREQISSGHVQLQVTTPIEGEGAEEGAPSEGFLEEGQAEGLMEGEGLTEGIVEGLLEGEEEGMPAEGAPEEGQGEGNEEGAVEEGLPEGMMEGEGVEEGEVEGLIEGSSEGEAEGQIEGAPEGSMEGQAEGGEEGSEEGVVEGQMEGEGSVEGQIEGPEEGAMEGQVEGQAEGLNEGEGGVEGEVEGEGILITSPGNGEDLSFGMVVVKRSGTETVWVENQGAGTLVVEAHLEKGGQIALEGEAQFSLAAGQSTELIVRFTPSRGGQYTDRLLISAGNQQIVINVYGQGIYVPLMSCHGEFKNPASTLWSDLWIMLFLGIALVIWSQIAVLRRMQK